MSFGTQSPGHEETYGAATTALPGAPSVADTPAPVLADGIDEVAERLTFWQHLHELYARNIGLLLVFLAQTFGSVMNVAAKLLTSQQSPDGEFHALHIIFVRMCCTAILGSLYMCYKKVPEPFGSRNVFGLLILRGTAGFLGLFGMYYSLSYLEISDATAITFLVPTWTAVLCYVWLKVGVFFLSLFPEPFKLSAYLQLQEPYGIQDTSAGLISLAGVLLIARPAFLFANMKDGQPVGSPSSPRRAMAVLFSIFSTFMAATAYSTIRHIGRRAHSLVSVNYFAVLSTTGSGLILLVHPDLHFRLPHGAMQWALLAVIGVAGFLLQFLLTEGLRRDACMK
ncbi:DUF6-domain-containing protein [Xylariaceae sp. FL1272]|nr:DUF6-domain-containing protein [Xylariaceae sp. FL1272]